MTPEEAAKAVGAVPSEHGWGYTEAPCPACGTQSVAITKRGWSCRWDACRSYGTDLADYVRRVRMRVN